METQTKEQKAEALVNSGAVLLPRMKAKKIFEEFRAGRLAVVVRGTEADYIVSRHDGCECPDHTIRGQHCKHMAALALAIRERERDEWRSETRTASGKIHYCPACGLECWSGLPNFKPQTDPVMICTCGKMSFRQECRTEALPEVPEETWWTLRIYDVISESPLRKRCPSERRASGCNWNPSIADLIQAGACNDDDRGPAPIYID